MMTLRPVLFLAISSLSLACGGSKAPDTTPPVAASAVEVSIASVTLADDCGTGPTTVPPEPAPAAAMAEPAAGDVAQGASAKMSLARRACEQSSIQLRVANATGAAAKVAIQKVELIDGSGATIGELTPRDPSRWSDDSYQAWDEEVAATQVLQVSYALSAPLVVRGATYTVRVTLAAGDDKRTLEQQTTLEAEASLPPGAVT